MYTWGGLTAPIVIISPPGNVLTNVPFTVTFDVNSNWGYWSTNSDTGPYAQFTTNGTSVNITDTTDIWYYGDNGVSTSDTNSYSYTIDTITPSVSIINGPSGDLTTNQSFTVSLSNTEPNGNWSTNTGMWNAFDGAFNITIEVGTTFLKYYAKDNAGNRSATITNAYTWDVTPPSVSVGNGPAGDFITNQSFVIQLDTTEADGYWRTNGGTWSSFAVSNIITIKTGTAYLLFYGKDALGNTGTATSNAYSWDTTPPSVSVSSGPTGNVTTNAGFAVQLTTDDDFGYWSTNGSSWDAFSGTTAFINVVVGTPYLIMYGEDQYRNKSTVATNVYAWDQVSPVVNITSGPTGNYTNNAVFGVTLTNDEPFGYWSTNSGAAWDSFDGAEPVSVEVGTVSLIYYGRDIHGNTSSITTNEYTWDVTAPTVSIISTPAGDFTTNASFDVQFATDEANGYWSTNGSAFTGFASGTTVTIEDGTTSLVYYGKDVYGNVSGTNTNTYLWDHTAPTVSIISGPAGHYTNNTAFNVTLTNDEAFGYYTTNGSLWTPFDPDVTVSIELMTPYLKYYGLDVYGNVSAIVSNGYSWDIVFPVVSVSNGPIGAYTTNQSFSITLDSTKPDGYWSTNGSDWNSFAASDTFDIETGTAYLLFYGKDALSNTSGTSSNAYVWDVTAPNVSIASGPAGDVLTNALFSVQLTTDENFGYWSTNGSTWVSYSGTIPFNDIEIGTPYLIMYGKDQYGNVSTVTTNEYTWDLIPPYVGVSAGPAGDHTNNTAFAVTLTNSDGTGYWSTNNSPWTNFTVSDVITIELGITTLKYYGRDIHGNTSVISTNAYTWDFTAPVVGVGPAGDFTTNAAFTVALTNSDGTGYWSTNGTVWESYSSGTNVLIQANISNLFYYAVDGFGNVSATNSNTYTWDYIAPVTGVGAGPAGDVTTNEAFDVTLTNSDGAGYWSTNGTLWESYTSSTNLTIQVDTDFLLFFGIDGAGNYSGTNSNAYTWISSNGIEFEPDEFYKLEPEYFLINNGENVLNIYLNFPVEYTGFSVEIFNENSSLVRTLDSSSIDAVNKLAEWDGEDEYGNLIAGIVYIRITAQSDTLGEKIVTGKIVALEQK
jgi:hypothetical protein